jgi:hypothetical protein
VIVPPRATAGGTIVHASALTPFPTHFPQVDADVEVEEAGGWLEEGDPEPQARNSTIPPADAEALVRDAGKAVEGAKNETTGVAGSPDEKGGKLFGADSLSTSGRLEAERGGPALITLAPTKVPGNSTPTFQPLPHPALSVDSSIGVHHTANEEDLVGLTGEEGAPTTTTELPEGVGVVGNPHARYSTPTFQPLAHPALSVDSSIGVHHTANDEDLGELAGEEGAPTTTAELPEGVGVMGNPHTPKELIKNPVNVTFHFDPRLLNDTVPSSRPTPAHDNDTDTNGGVDEAIAESTLRLPPLVDSHNQTHPAPVVVQLKSRPTLEEDYRTKYEDENDLWRPHANEPAPVYQRSEQLMEREDGRVENQAGGEDLMKSRGHWKKHRPGVMAQGESRHEPGQMPHDKPGP